MMFHAGNDVEDVYIVSYCDDDGSGDVYHVSDVEADGFNLMSKTKYLASSALMEPLLDVSPHLTLGMVLMMMMTMMTMVTTMMMMMMACSEKSGPRRLEARCQDTAQRVFIQKSSRGRPTSDDDYNIHDDEDIDDDDDDEERKGWFHPVMCLRSRHSPEWTLSY